MCDSWSPETGTSAFKMSDSFDVFDFRCPALACEGRSKPSDSAPLPLLGGMLLSRLTGSRDPCSEPRAFWRIFFLLFVPLHRQLVWDAA